MYRVAYLTTLLAMEIVRPNILFCPELFKVHINKVGQYQHTHCSRYINIKMTNFMYIHPSLYIILPLDLSIKQSIHEYFFCPLIYLYNLFLYAYLPNVLTICSNFYLNIHSYPCGTCCRLLKIV